jgi:hypothetical protein
VAQRIDALKFRMGINSLWSSQWYANKNYAGIFFEDCLIRRYLMRIFDLRGFLSKRCLIKRRNSCIFIFTEFLSNSFVKFQVPRHHRKKKKLFHKLLKLRNITNFLKTLSKKKIYISFKNLFLINRMHRSYVKRLRGIFGNYKRYKFTLNIINVFNIVVRVRSAFFLCKIISQELVFVNKKKRDKKIWPFVSFIRKIVQYIKGQNTALHGIRIHLKGRFKGANRSKINRYVQGAVPFNTIRASIDYCNSKSVTVNGSFGIHVWTCYRSV